MKMDGDCVENGAVGTNGVGDVQLQKSIPYVEFLVNPERLKQHLAKRNPSMLRKLLLNLKIDLILIFVLSAPSAEYLLTLFLKHSLNPMGKLKEKPTDVVEIFEHPYHYGIYETKVHGLWVLSLKTASLIDWDLRVLER